MQRLHEIRAFLDEGRRALLRVVTGTALNEHQLADLDKITTTWCVLGQEMEAATEMAAAPGDLVPRCRALAESATTFQHGLPRRPGQEMGEVALRANLITLISTDDRDTLTKRVDEMLAVHWAPALKNLRRFLTQPKALAVLVGTMLYMFSIDLDQMRGIDRAELRATLFHLRAFAALLCTEEESTLQRGLVLARTEGSKPCWP